MVRVSLRRHLLCFPQLEEFLELNPELQANGRDRELCSALLRYAPAAVRADQELQLRWLLRSNGCAPSALGKCTACGVVVEFGTDNGVDALAAYSDGSVGWYDAAAARYKEVLPSGESSLPTSDLFAAVERAGLAKGVRPEVPPPPPRGFAQIVLVTGEGWAVGAGLMRDLAFDALAGPIVRASLALREHVLRAGAATGSRQV